MSEKKLYYVRKDTVIRIGYVDRLKELAKLHMIAEYAKDRESYAILTCTKGWLPWDDDWADVTETILFKPDHCDEFYEIEQMVGDPALPDGFRRVKK